MAKKGLGKGIDVLIPQAKEKTKSEKENIKTKEVIKEVVKEVIKEVDTIDINKIEPNKNQPRKSFDEDSIHELAESINSTTCSAKGRKRVIYNYCRREKMEGCKNSRT